MTREQLISLFNSQIDILGLEFSGKINVESAAQMKFGDLTSDSLEELQLAMALEEEVGIDLELDTIRNSPTLLDAIDLILEMKCRH